MAPWKCATLIIGIQRSALACQQVEKNLVTRQYMLLREHEPLLFMHTEPASKTFGICES
ncbi:hypothetical protein KIN20_017109 [Parelaphostrongylus tenuis]|uniref:Uncharacterized protein n=1 Tax=Parelaphostrongylus tenuis TaxID=148309 RepID=A0AAD5QQF1_PARTN|nr:hypothetical protein KIN20_017109 [Parelaphostrongylus tenuis]